MTGPTSSNVPVPEPPTGDPASGLPTAYGGIEPEAGAVMPVEVPVPVPVVVPAAATAAEPWAGAVIEPVPTTAEDIAALVLAVPDVTRLHAGRFGEVATYLPGRRRITGIKLGDDLIEVHVVVAGQVPIRVTAQLIHAAVATVVATPVHVFVEDVAVA